MFEREIKGSKYFEYTSGNQREDNIAIMKKVKKVFLCFCVTLSASLLLSPCAEAKTAVKTTSSSAAFAKAASNMVKKNKVKTTVGASAADEKFNTARLIVKTKGKGVDFSKYKASYVIKGDGNIYLVQFDSIIAARNAQKALKKLSNVVYADSDQYCGAAEKISEYDENQCAGLQPEWEKAYLEAAEQGGTACAAAVSSAASVTAAAGTAAGSKSTKISWGTTVMNTDAFAKYVKSNSSGSVTVAVIDSGVSSHPQLKGRLVHGYDYVDNDDDPSDLFGHGTHVAGIINACTPGLKVKIMPIRVLDKNGGGCGSIVGCGIRYAVDHGASVINLSLRLSKNAYVEEEIKYAIKKNVVVVVASGNDYGDTKWYSPCNMMDSIVVGAVNRSDKRAFYSNYGKSLDVTAPGDEIISTSNKNGYVSMSGTSMAAPHVSAEAAMYRMLYPKYKPKEIEKLIRSSTQDLGEAGWDKYYGTGRVVLKVESGKSPSKEKIVQVSNIYLVNTPLDSVHEEGSTLFLLPEIFPDNASNKTLSWSSSNTKIATVEDGVVRCLKPGRVEITVKSINGKKASVEIRITRKASKSLTKGLKNVPPAVDINESRDKFYVRKVAVPLTLGSHNLRFNSGGIVSFTAPTTRTYTFSFDRVRSVVYPSEYGKSYGDWAHAWIKMLTLKNGEYRMMELTSGEIKDYDFGVATSDYASFNYEKPYSPYYSLPKRTVKAKIKKGQTVYIYMETSCIQDNDKDSHSVALRMRIE